MVAPAMVIFEATVTGHMLNHGPEMQLLEPLGRAMPFLIGGYLIVRLADVMLRGVMWAALTPSLDSAWWWLEMVALLAAQAYFLSPEARARSRSLFVAALATVVAVVVHRTGVAIVGIEVPEYAPYVPAWPEVMITVGIAALGLLAFRVAAEHLPVYERVEVRETVRERGRPEAVRQPAYVADADARW
jgi:Ni/Fe-hydrogenase subunit HybB-like protein